MKKNTICLVLCILGLCSMGQGTAYITKSNAVGYAQMIRQYKNNPGHHVVYFTDAVSGVKGYIGITDIYNTFKYVQICKNCTIKDIEVFGNNVFFCGQTSTNKGVIGYVDLSTMGVAIDSTNLFSTSLDNIEVYEVTPGSNTHIAGYGTIGGDYVGFDYDMMSTFNFVRLPYVPLDIALTNNYIVFAGNLSPVGISHEIVIHPIPKNPSFVSLFSPYYYYPVGTTTENEPYNYHLRVVAAGNDAIATLTHRYYDESGTYSMVLREFDVSNAFINFYVPMITSYRANYDYSIGDFYDFQYDAANMTYAVFHNYEVTPSNYQDVVTRIDFSSGIPATVKSDYLAMPYQVMKSMALSDSAMYVVYGYDATSKANVLWKDYQNAVVPGSCLSYGIMPFNSISSVPPNKTEVFFTGSYRLPSLSLNSASPLSERMLTICH